MLRRAFNSGTNSYNLMVEGKGQPQRVDEVLTSAKSLGITVLRTWAFNDNHERSDSSALQVSTAAAHTHVRGPANTRFDAAMHGSAASA